MPAAAAPLGEPRPPLSRWGPGPAARRGRPGHGAGPRRMLSGSKTRQSHLERAGAAHEAQLLSEARRPRISRAGTEINLKLKLGIKAKLRQQPPSQSAHICGDCKLRRSHGILSITNAAQTTILDGHTTAINTRVSCGCGLDPRAVFANLTN